MSEWWSYTLSDFLLFSPRTYYRLFERLNAELWPVALLGICLGLILLRGQTPRRWQIAFLCVGVLWAFVAVVFLWQRYGAINWAARYFAWGFVIESLLLLWTGVFRWKHIVTPAVGLGRIAGFGFLIVSIVLYPLVAFLVGRPVSQAEIFGLAPDPTVIGTLGLLLLARPPRRWLLLPLPLLWCLITGATLRAMGSPEAWVSPLAGIFTIVAAVTARLRKKPTPRPQP